MTQSERQHALTRPLLLRSALFVFLFFFFFHDQRDTDASCSHLWAVNTDASFDRRWCRGVCGPYGALHSLSSVRMERADSASPTTVCHIQAIFCSNFLFTIPPSGCRSHYHNAKVCYMLDKPSVHDRAKTHLQTIDSELTHTSPCREPTQA